MRVHVTGIIAVSMALTLSACGNVSHDVAKDGHDAGELVWPAPDSVTPMHKGGTFPNLANLRQVRAGLNKQQLSDLIGYPHFSEGVWGVREWNYVFKFRKPNSDELTTCQYKVLFDDSKLTQSFYWQPESCASYLTDEALPEAIEAPAKPMVTHYDLSADALFAFDKADILPQGRQPLDKIAEELKRRDGTIEAVQVTGYTDRLGSDGYNLSLSQRRAEAVNDYLADHGVTRERIHAEGRGKSQPGTRCEQRPRNELIACLAPDRRVTVEIKAKSSP